MEHSEGYTSVTSHGTKPLDTHCSMKNEIVQYPIQKQHKQQVWDLASPPTINSTVPVFPVPVAHFLSACYLCKQKLSHGKDIYMYRGDKAFCSMECRYQQILMDDGMALPTDFDG